MLPLNLEGLGVALATPFNTDFSIDYNSLERLINFVIDGGIDYIVVLGTTAETPTLTLKEKNDVAAFIKNVTAGRLPLVIGIGGNNTMGVIDEIKSRDLDGFDAILSVVPYYNKPNQEGIFQHFALIEDNSPLPILLYNVPGRTGVNMSAETTLRLAEYSSKFCGVKEASGSLSQSEIIIKKAPSNFKVISGDDSLIAPLMMKGAKGVISVLANACPSIVKKLITLCNKGEFDKAINLQASLNPLISHLFEDGNPAGVKALLSNMGLAKNILRLPLVPVSKGVEEKILNKSSEIKLLK